MNSAFPQMPRDISPDWLGQVLQRDVAECHVEDAHFGTTGRVVLAVKYPVDNAGPDRLFVKLPPADQQQREFVVSSGMGLREAKFYRSLAAELPVRVPHCFYADWTPDGRGYIMLLEHLEDSGCTFRNASKRYSLTYVQSVLSAFARLHAQFWESPRFRSDLSWLAPPVQHDSGRALIERALSQYGSEMPEVFSSAASLYIENTDAIHKLWNLGSPTLIHGDVHDGNMFFDHDAPGFLDWALVARGSAMRDVGYFLAGTLSIEHQKKHYFELLAYYREQLQRCGAVAPSLNDLEEQYRWHTLYVWVGAAATLAMGDAWQPDSYVKRSLERLHSTLEQHNSVQAILDSI